MASAAIVTIPSQSGAEDIDSMMDMSLSELMEVRVTSVSKKAEKATDAAAAIFVVTAEDIKRSGATNIPEVLRMAPGVQVSRINSHAWAISARGMASNFSNKLLVLVDGRSIYNPLFSGVLWEEQSVPLEEIERIEVIRGPGATLWGANAVNGIINIITKHTAETEGGVAVATAGTFLNQKEYLRYGGELGESTNYRAWSEYYDHGGSKNVTESEKDDDWKMARVGFRTDSELSEYSSLTTHGQVFWGERNEPFDYMPSLTGTPSAAAGGLVTPAPDQHDISGGSILSKYSYTFENESELELQAYYDFSSRKFDILKYNIHTLDLDAQHAFEIGESQEFIWGLGYRVVRADMEGSTIVRFSPDEEQETVHLFSGFLQDKIELVEDELFLTLGSKFEYNSYTDFEVQPNARFAWYPAENQTVWGAVSRAVRTPSISERTLTQVLTAVPNPFAPPPTVYTAVIGNDDFESEELIAYELGYRFKAHDNVSVDLTAFHNDYDNFRTLELGAPAATDIPLAIYVDNKASAQASGVEVASTWQIQDNWSLTGSYSYLNLDIVMDSDSLDSVSEAQEEDSPKHMLNMRSHYEITNDLHLDNSLYYVDSLQGGSVEDYLRFDAQVSWQAMDDVELKLVGQNLLDNQHQEFGGARYNSVSEIPRAVYGQITVRF